MDVADLAIYDMLERSAILYASRTALVEDDRRLSYLELKKMVDSLSVGLITRGGVNPGDRIGVLASNCLEYLLLYLAAARVGAILVPINFRLVPEEMAFIFKDTNPVLLFCHPEFHRVVDGLGVELSSVKGFYSTGRARGRFSEFEDLISGENTPSPRTDIGSDNPIVIFYTAATAGRPKGAILTQANILASNIQLSSSEALYFGSDDVFLAFLPFSHVFGLIAAMAIFEVGGVNVVQGRFDADVAVELINEEKVTVFFTFAPILKSIIDVMTKKNSSLPSLRLVTGLEAPESIEQLQNLTRAKFWTTYGQGETTGPVAFALFDSRPGSAGRPTPLASVRIVDTDDQPVQAGELGEIVIRGPLVFSGYWGRSEDTSYTFRGGWHHTGDMGRFDEDGYLWYKGRKAEKELIKPGGENVYPAEVENAVLCHPGVAEAVVIGVPHPKWGEGIKLICVLWPDKKVSKEELVEFVGSRIARYKKPHFVTFVNSLPKTASSQIDRAQVKAKYGKE